MHSKLEDVKELPGGHAKVDVIISEWMGYCLFYESMVRYFSPLSLTYKSFRTVEHRTAGARSLVGGEWRDDARQGESVAVRD